VASLFFFFFFFKNVHYNGIRFRYDVDGDCHPELLIGYSNGSVEARRIETGEIIWTQSFGKAVSAFLDSSLRDGVVDLTIVLSNGESMRPLTIKLRK
jgi:hypothetical protein